MKVTRTNNVRNSLLWISKINQKTLHCHTGVGRYPLKTIDSGQQHAGMTKEEKLLLLKANHIPFHYLQLINRNNLRFIEQIKMRRGR